MRRILREPLLHFMIIGAAILGADRALAGPAEDDDPRRVYMSADMVELLARRHEDKTGQPVDAEARAALVDQFVRSEVLQREARALGLDRGDLVVQRRLAQKMEFLLESRASLDPPTDEDLLAWRDAHPDRYRRRDRLRFEQRLFSTERHGEQAMDRARAAWARIAEDPRVASQVGDPSAHAPILSLDPSAIHRRFGPRFEASLRALPQDRWSEPIPSRQGVHLVRVVDVVPGELPGLDEIGKRLREDLLRDRRRRARDAAIETLTSRYEVELESGALAVEVVS